MIRNRSSRTELLVGPRTWANTGALFLLIGGLLLVGGDGFTLRTFALLVLGQGAKALWVGVELQFGGEPNGRGGLARLLLLSGGILVTLGVARVMGTSL
jgi:hypothetical protein